MATKASTSRSAGTGSLGHGHQNSTARKPAAYAAAGRSSSGSSAKSREQLAAYGNECMIFHISEVNFW